MLADGVGGVEGGATFGTSKSLHLKLKLCKTTKMLFNKLFIEFQ